MATRRVVPFSGLLRSWVLVLLVGAGVWTPNANALVGDPCAVADPSAVGANPRFAVHEDVDYTAPGITSHCGQRYNLFVPAGTPPANGWPCLIAWDLTSYVASRRRSVLSDADALDRLAGLALASLDNGIAVIYASSTVSRGGQSPNTVSDPVYDPWAGDYGPAYPGNGVFLPPGFLPTDYSGSVPPFDDPARPMTEKDIVMLVQHVKFHGDEGLPPNAPAAQRVPIDTSRIAMFGSSSAAIVVSWCALGPDRAPQVFPGAAPGTQQALDTRVAAAILQDGPLHLPHIVPTVASGVHFPELLGGVHGYDSPGLKTEDTDPQFVDGVAVLSYALEPGPTALNADQSFLLVQRHASGLTPPLTLDVDAVSGGQPTGCGLSTPYEGGIDAVVHSSWVAHVLKLNFPNAGLVAQTNAAYDANGCPSGAAPTGLPDATLPLGSNQAVIVAAQLDWLLAELQPEPWTDLGGGSPGVAGIPQLTGEGTLTGGSQTSLSLTDGPRQALCLLWVSFASLPLSFFGGTLHAFPFDEQVLLGTDIAGGFSGSASWPSGVPPGTQVWFQVLLGDGTVPAGITLSNAILATAP